MDQDKTTLLIKLDKDLKESFQQVCKMQDTDISKEIRAFMREYVRKNGQADLFKTTKRKQRTVSLPSLITMLPFEHKRVGQSHPEWVATEWMVIFSYY